MVRASCIFGFLLRLFDVRRRSNQLRVRFFRPRRRNRQRQRRNDYGSAAQRAIGYKVVLGAQTENRFAALSFQIRKIRTVAAQSSVGNRYILLIAGLNLRLLFAAFVRGDNIVPVSVFVYFERTVKGGIFMKDE